MPFGEYRGTAPTINALLTRLEGEIAFLDLFRTYPKLRLAVPIDPLQWRSGVLFRGLETLSLLL